MIDYTDREKRTSDENVIFTDGLVTVICEKADMFLPVEVEAYRIALDGQYSEPISLKDIQEKYPNVRKVIFDTALKGYVYNYGNHMDEKTKEPVWECVGKTIGYA